MRAQRCSSQNLIVHQCVCSLIIIITVTVIVIVLVWTAQKREVSGLGVSLIYFSGTLEGKVFQQTELASLFYIWKMSLLNMHSILVTISWLCIHNVYVLYIHVKKVLYLLHQRSTKIMQQVIANTQPSDCQRWRLSWRPPSVGPGVWIPQHDWECAAWECGIPEEAVNIPLNLLNQHSAAGSACHGMQRWMRFFVFF